MPETMPRTDARGRRRGFDRQEAIVTAMDLFWEHGYEATSVSQLCTAIGINPPSLYAAFDSKSQLFLDVLDSYERSFWDPVWDAFDRESNVHQAFFQFFDDIIEVISAPGTRQGCLVTLSTVSLKERGTEVSRALSGIRAEAARRTRAKLDAGIRDGQVPEGTDTLALALAVGVMVDGLAIQAHDGAEPDLLRRLASAGMHMIPDAG